MKEKRNLFLRTLGNLWKTFFSTCYLPSVFCYIFVELCSRRSVTGLCLFFLREPIVFLYNAWIIAATVSVCLLFKRRIFVRSVLLLLWAAVGVTDFILLSFRTTPFTAVDLTLLKDAFTIANRYLSLTGVILIAAGIVAAFALCIYLFRKAKKEEEPMDYKIRIPFCLCVAAVCLVLTNAGMAAGLLDRNFGNLAEAFHDNGLPYCFMNSVLNTGVEKPDNYSAETMEEFLEEFEEEGRELNEMPNIIFLQLESFFDVKYIENASFSQDPVPFFTQLRENYPSGFLEVPSIGAGTANTEFECLTGMNLDFFGPGEYPYKTILKERTCESLAYILKDMGYTTSAIHNNDGTFYDRHAVFPNLGFDRYLSLEYMTRIEVNELNWTKDKVLTGQIMKVLSKTKEKDFIYAISVQGHGAYPEEPLISDKKLDVKLPEELSEYYYQYLYYVHQLSEMDRFIKELVLNLSACREKVILVLYGDHLPSLGLSEELLKNGNAYQTEYVIWNNFGLSAENMDLQSYQLSSRVLQLLGAEGGIMPKYHELRRNDEDYLEGMQLLMYDMLYGDMEVYEGENPYEPTNMQMGIEPIRIQDVYVKEALLTKDEPLLYVEGQNFTKHSRIIINGETAETIYLTDRLLATTELPKSRDGIYQIAIRQQGNDEIPLSETETTEYYLEQ